MSCGGQVVLPPGYLAAVYEEMRAEGALCVADEVGGRTGMCMLQVDIGGCMVRLLWPAA